MLANQIPAPSPEIQGLVSALADIVVALKSGEGAIAAVQAAIPDLMAAVATLGNVGTDVKSPANQAYILWGIAQVFENAEST